VCRPCQAGRFAQSSGLDLCNGRSSLLLCYSAHTLCFISLSFSVFPFSQSAPKVSTLKILGRAPVRAARLEPLLLDSLRPLAYAFSLLRFRFLLPLCLDFRLSALRARWLRTLPAKPATRAAKVCFKPTGASSSALSVFQENTPTSKESQSATTAKKAPTRPPTAP
jgi:hypothetical protein